MWMIHGLIQQQILVKLFLSLKGILCGDMNYLIFRIAAAITGNALIRFQETKQVLYLVHGFPGNRIGFGELKVFQSKTDGSDFHGDEDKKVE